MLLYAAMIFFGALMARDIYRLIRSLIFYKKNGWDFSVDFGPRIYHSTSDLPEIEMTPREKLTQAPIMILIYTVILGCLAVTSFLA